MIYFRVPFEDLQKPLNRPATEISYWLFHCCYLLWRNISPRWKNVSGILGLSPHMAATPNCPYMVGRCPAVKGAHSLGINDSGITEYQERWSQGTSNPSLNCHWTRFFFPYTQGTMLWGQIWAKISCLLYSYHHSISAPTKQHEMNSISTTVDFTLSETLLCCHIGSLITFLCFLISGKYQELSSPHPLLPLEKPQQSSQK